MQNRLQVLLLYRAQGGGFSPFAVQSYNENCVKVQMTCLDREAFFLRTAWYVGIPLSLRQTINYSYSHSLVPMTLLWYQRIENIPPKLTTPQPSLTVHVII